MRREAITFCGGDESIKYPCLESFGSVAGAAMAEFFAKPLEEGGELFSVVESFSNKAVSYTTNKPIGSLECIDTPQFYKHSRYIGPSGVFDSYEIPFCYKDNYYVLTNSHKNPLGIYSDKISDKNLVFENGMKIGKEELPKNIMNIVHWVTDNLLEMPDTCSGPTYKPKGDWTKMFMNDNGEIVF